MRGPPTPRDGAPRPCERLERSGAELESRGAGIVVLEQTSRYLRERTDRSLDDATVGTTWLRYLDAGGATVSEDRRPYRCSGWLTLCRVHLECLGRERYHLGREVTRFEQSPEHVTLAFRDGEERACELLVCADGIRSTSRARLLPEARPSYAGSVAWRGTVPEERLEARDGAVAARAAARGRGRGDRAPVRPGDLRHRGVADGVRTRLPDRRRGLRAPAAHRGGHGEGGRRRGALADALAAAEGRRPAALRAWEARQLAIGRAALERWRRNGDRSQLLGTWRPGDPDLAYGLLGRGA